MQFTIGDRKFQLSSIIGAIILVLYIAFCLFPIIWIIMTSFKNHAAINTYPPQFIFAPTGDNYQALLRDHDFMEFLGNSVFAAAGSTALVMLLGVPASFAIARYRIGGDGLANWILSMRMFPPIALAVPMFLMFRTVGLLQTIWVLIIVYTLMNLPFAIWLMVGFFQDIPQDINDAALIDGCSVWSSLWRVNVPAAAPGLAAAAILSIIFAWNEFLFAVILGGSGAKTIPVAVSGFVTDRAIFWGPMSAASTIALIPMVIFSMFVGRYLVRGLTMGAVK